MRMGWRQAMFEKVGLLMTFDRKLEENIRDRIFFVLV